MASTIITKNSSTAGAVPLAANLTQGELAINTTDRRLYTKDATGTVVEVGSGTAIVYRENFSGNDVTTVFTMAHTPVNEDLVDVYINGIYQNKDTFSVSTNVITFTEAPVSGTDNIEVMIWQSAPIGSTDANYVSYTPAGTGAVATTVQTKLREWVSVKDFSAVGDGVTDDTAAISDTSTNDVYALVPEGTYKISEVAITGQCGFIGLDPASTVRNDTNNEKTLFFSDNGTTRNSRIRVESLAISDGGTDTSDDDAAMFSSGVDLSGYVGNYVYPSYVGISSQYGNITLGPYSGNPASENQPLRQSRNNYYAFNAVQASFMGYEFFSSLRHRIIGNTAFNDGTTASSHAYRFTGFPGMPCDYNAFVGNVGDKYATGLSVQTSTHFNNFSSFVFSNITTNGVTLNPNSTYASDHNGFNYFQGIVDSADNGFYGDNPSYNYVNLIAKDCTSIAVHLDSTTNFGDKQHCLIDLVSKDCAQALRIETDNNVARITSADLTGNAVEIVGNNNIVDVVVDGVVNASGKFSLLVSGNKNIVRCIALNNSTPATSDVSVSGNDNHVTVFAATGVSCTGARNTIEGNLGNVVSLAGSTDTILRGTVNSVTRGGTNTDYTGLRGGSGRGQVSTTTDVNGEVTVTVSGIPTGLTVIGAIAQFLNFSSNRYIVVKSSSVTSNTLTLILRFMNDNGTPAASTAVFAYYQFFAY